MNQVMNVHNLLLQSSMHLLVVLLANTMYCRPHATIGILCNSDRRTLC